MTTCFGNCCSPGCRLWCLRWCLFVLSLFPRGCLGWDLELNWVSFWGFSFLLFQTEWRYHPKPYLRVTRAVGDWQPFRVVLGWAYRGLTGGFLLLQNFSVAISVSPRVCFILVLILISMFLRLCIYELGIFHANQTTKCLRNQGRTKGEGWSGAN